VADHRHRSRRRLEHPAGDAQQRGLAAAVVTDEHHALAGADLDVDRPERRRVAVGLRQLVCQ
jgi:hypothetical protein